MDEFIYEKMLNWFILPALPEQPFGHDVLTLAVAWLAFAKESEDFQGNFLQNGGQGQVVSYSK